jgi:hypothetical protein
MARGFESKSVQDQQSEDIEAREMRSKPRRDPQDIERDKKRESLELSRRHVMNDIEATTSETRRNSLKAALAHLDGELAKLG